jgi:hypothetical protein
MNNAPVGSVRRLTRHTVTLVIASYMPWPHAFRSMKLTEMGEPGHSAVVNSEKEGYFFLHLIRGRVWNSSAVSIRTDPVTLFGGATSVA